MTKAEIIKAVADSTSENKKLVADICNAFLFEIQKNFQTVATSELQDWVNGK